MRVLLIRHATAVPAGTRGIADEDRRLTARGRRRFEAAARGLAKLVPRPDAILSSPLPRALETATIAATAWGGRRVRVEPALAGGTLAALEESLAALAPDATVVLVGHEPQLSELLARVLGGRRGERVPFKKGGAALVLVPGRLGGGGSLLGFWSPKLLRRLAD
jgi:phosphohistidine phosphatase